MSAIRLIRPAGRLIPASRFASIRPSSFRQLAPVTVGPFRSRNYATASGAKEMTVRDALNAAMAEEMESNDKVFVLGEEVAQYNGAQVQPHGRFGPCRTIDC